MIGKCYGIGRGDDCRLGQGEENKGDTQDLVEVCPEGVIGVAASQGTSFYWTKEGIVGFCFFVFFALVKKDLSSVF